MQVRLYVLYASHETKQKVPDKNFNVIFVNYCSFCRRLSHRFRLSPEVKSPRLLLILLILTIYFWSCFIVMNTYIVDKKFSNFLVRACFYDFTSLQPKTLVNTNIDHFYFHIKFLSDNFLATILRRHLETVFWLFRLLNISYLVFAGFLLPIIIVFLRGKSVKVWLIKSPFSF